jgi:hypothetical protein
MSDERASFAPDPNVWTNVPPHHSNWGDGPARPGETEPQAGDGVVKAALAHRDTGTAPRPWPTRQARATCRGAWELLWSSPDIYGDGCRKARRRPISQTARPGHPGKVTARGADPLSIGLAELAFVRAPFLHISLIRSFLRPTFGAL